MKLSVSFPLSQELLLATSAPVQEVAKERERRKASWHYFPSALEIVTVLTFSHGDRCNYPRKENEAVGSDREICPRTWVQQGDSHTAELPESRLPGSLSVWIPTSRDPTLKRSHTIQLRSLPTWAGIM